MKQRIHRFISIFFCSIVSLNMSVAQHYSFNSGETKQKGYLTIVDYEEIKGKIFINATINGKAHKFLLDTGAPLCITESLYKEINASVVNKIIVNDQSGLADSLSVAHIDKLTIGDIDFEHCIALVVPTSSLFECYQISGFIGSNLLRNSILQINASRKQITITDDIKKLEIDAKPIPMVLNKVQSSPYIWVKLKNKKKGSNQVLVDSGMDGLYDIATEHFVKLNDNHLFNDLQFGNGSNTIGLHGAAENINLVKGNIPNFTVGRVLFENIKFQTTSGRDSRIGSDFFKYGIMTLDYLNRKFYFQPYLNMQKDLSEKTFVLAPTVKDEKLVVGVIWDDALLDKINIGDQILSIDELDYSNFDLCDLFLKTSPLLTRDNILLKYKTKDGTVKTLQLQKQ